MTERISQIERHHLAQIHEQLDVNRLIEPELLAQLRHVFRRSRACLARQHVRRIARRKMQQREVEQDDRQQRRDGERQPAPDVGESLWRQTSVYFASQA